MPEPRALARAATPFRHRRNHEALAIQRRYCFVVLHRKVWLPDEGYLVGHVNPVNRRYREGAFKLEFAPYRRLLIMVRRRGVRSLRTCANATHLRLTQTRAAPLPAQPGWGRRWRLDSGDPRRSGGIAHDFLHSARRRRRARGHSHVPLIATLAKAKVYTHFVHITRGRPMSIGGRTRR